jgi:tetratricopeptide (TPR) repeat protein
MTTEVSHSSEDVDMEDAEGTDDEEEELYPSLIIPVTSSMTSSMKFIEIFPEELHDIASSTILQVLKDEDAELNTWADVALMYMQQRQSRESSTMLQAACEIQANREQKVRILASAGIALLTEAQQSQSSAPGGIKRPGGDPKDELRSMADNRFTHASKVDTLFPMTWIGRGMLNLSAARLDQARFFFDTTLKQCGPVLPALLGMAAVLYGEKDYKGAQEMYAKAMRLYPVKSGSSTRVGFGLACYRLGQVDRAKASFARALDMDRENVEAMVGSAVLDMASLDETSQDFGSRAEKAIKMISMANLLDHSNAMVQNHLANHYFWHWTPVTGTVEMTQGSNVVKGSQIVQLDAGERVRIGTDFETYVTEDTAGEEGEDDEDTATFRIKDSWKEPTTGGLKLWKKDYDRVVALAKGAYSSTSVKEIQAESLFFLARVYHVREDFDNALKFYEKSCKLAPSLSPARFGLAQVLIMQEKYADAAAHLKLVIGTSARATDALALLGLLEVREGKNTQDGLLHIRKAIDLDPLNPDLVVLEALALQQHESNYAKALERYQKAVELMTRRGRKVHYEIYTNIGVVCHETKKFDKALEMYKQAFEALDEDATARDVRLDSSQEIEGGAIVLKENDVFFGYADTELLVEVTLLDAREKSSDGDTTEVAAEKEGGQSTEEGADGSAEKMASTEESSGKEDESNAVYQSTDKVNREADETNAGGSTGATSAATSTEHYKDALAGTSAPNTTALKVLGDHDAATLPLRVGDHIRIGDTFESEILMIAFIAGEVKLTVKGVFDEKENSKTSWKVFVKRGNKRLDKPEAISIAFNLARLHEAVGKPLAAIEIHRAIVKRNPSYVNSYLRLACIARDCGCLTECAEWLKISATVAPGNPEVLTLIGNLHLSLCDWAPAQNVFDGLLAKKVPNVEAYAMLSLGNIYFNNLHISPKRYAKHLQYASDYYKRILQKDTSNAYAANGLGAVLAEKGELFKAKEVFNRVREVQENIADALLNLGHICKY